MTFIEFELDDGFVCLKLGRGKAYRRKHRSLHPAVDCKRQASPIACAIFNYSRMPLTKRLATTCEKSTNKGGI